ncbi:MAG: cupin domain-containing protein [Nitrospirota bacterium]
MISKRKKDPLPADAAPSCDWTSPPVKGKERRKRAGSGPAERDRIHRCRPGCRWSGVKTERYKQKDGGWSSIVRKVLVGNKGEATKFHLRYFEIAPGGYSSLEQHRHAHVVIGVRGKGKVRMGKRLYAIGHLDTVYIGPDTVHQLTNPYDEPFGFFCIVDARRDRPRPVEDKTGKKR